MAKARIDQLLVTRGLAESRARAQAMILAGNVFVAGARVDKAGTMIAEDAPIDVRGAEHPYVSRGGVKLAGALDAFGIDVRNLRCLDVGASTGGFTDCLLQRGARRVVAVDVGYGQLAWKLRQDPRVVVRERTNARSLTAEMLPERPDVAVIDASFISLATVLPAVAPLVTPGGTIVALVKPQFEVGRGRVGKGGVVRDPALRAEAVGSVRAVAERLGLVVRGEADSVLPGPKGNREVFLWGTRGIEPSRGAGRIG